MKKTLIAIILLTVSLYANNSEINGEDVFLSNCANCHSIKGRESYGPELNLVSYKRTRSEIKDYIVRPGRVFRDFGYKSNAMPELPLSPEEVEAVVDYVDGLQPFKEHMKKQ